MRACILAWSVSLAACGGSSDDTGASDESETETGSCDFTACGGDLVGAWLWSGDSCTTGAFEHASCPGMTIDDHGTQSSITVTFAGDGTYTYAISDDADYTATWPAECVQELDAAECSTYEMHAGNGLTIECTGDATSGCVCDYEGGDRSHEPNWEASWLAVRPHTRW